MVTRKPVLHHSAVPVVPTIPHIRIEEPTPTQHEPPEPWETFDSDPEDTVDPNRTEQHWNRPESDTDQVPAILKPGAATTPSYQTLEEDNVWIKPDQSDADDGSGNESDIERVPTVLRPGSGGMKKQPAKMGEQKDIEDEFVRVPAVLRPGGGAAKPETNPFKRKIMAQATGGSNPDEGLNRPPVPPTAPPSGPSILLPSFSQLSLQEQNSNPWSPAPDERKESATTPPVPPIPEQDIGNDIWDSAKPSRQATPGPGSHSPALISLPSEEGSARWEDESQKASAAPPPIPAPDQEVLEDSHAWDDLVSLDKGKPSAKAAQVPTGGSTGSDDWNLIDVDAPPGPPPKQVVSENSRQTENTSTEAPSLHAPSLPPRDSAQNTPPPPQPPRPVDKNETYQIKNINWYDATASKKPRTSPILVQNANGPCPLVALVNALSLTTPANQTNTALVEALRSRERISLGLLLDTVFDELMSERRTNSDVDLPDVAELYDFLKGLHTGMNVNPRFIPTHEAINLLKRTSLTHIHPTDRTNLIPGTFENTKEMALYATFSIPLIHGWLPARDEAVYDAFVRQAASYEDAQNLLFREEELEDKLSSPHHQGITDEEGQIYQDILTIKSFLSTSATQLTSYGLDVIRQSMKPGSVAILFRNDHFSTLYRHPQTLELLTLVTDAGYASHEEVVWESLVDVNGERAEFFSGDFRLVGGAHHDQDGGQSHSRSGSYAEAAAGNRDGSSNDGGNWSTVQGSRQGQNQQSRSQRRGPDDPPISPTHEQEDRDLALALQLQEEEDERHRVELARRRRESQLSEQFIEQQGRGGGQAGAGRGNGHGGGGGPTAPARRSSNTVNSVPITATSSNTPSLRGGRGGARGGAAATGMRQSGQTQPQGGGGQNVRPLVPPAVPPRTNRAADDGLDDAPPSYEQASKQTPYVPPAGHPSHPASQPGSPGAGASSSSLGSGSVGVGAGAGGRRGGLRQGVPVRQSGAGGPGSGPGPGGRERDRDCVVM